MPRSSPPSHDSADFRPLAEAVIDLFDCPAAIVAGGAAVLARDDPWLRVTGRPSAPGRGLTLEDSLGGFSQTQPLIAALRNGAPLSGLTTLSGTSEDQRPRRFTARWRQIAFPRERCAVAVVSLVESTESDPLRSIITRQRARIDQLLIRQALIEESERRRLGRCLHDVVAQTLALIRAGLADHAQDKIDVPGLVAMLDRVIDDTRTLAFELSPPILDDLGLRPALQWLAEHLGKRYNAPISVEDGCGEPRLSKSARVIVFRAVRELMINAAKHAPGTAIKISCAAGEEKVVIVVSDAGPGFDARIASNGFGLLSVEQQLRGLGGSLVLESIVGDGTTATLEVPYDLDGLKVGG